ncbi:unnamed protein product [Rotaria sordida]|uniref:PLAT domain-containing protein n=1 Tax=Rotaria sordida TaxID=392033 RepID=A0A814AJQ1_9BILA|nr:unnamed protein product [Rotaria sordida]
MNINTGFFPPYGYRRKHTTGAYNLSLNNQQHHHASVVQSARSSIESTNGNNESFLPSISTINGNNEGHKPYRRNDFANNHLFIAKRKLARVFLGEPSRNLQATSDLIHLFDQEKPKRKNRNVNQSQRQEDKNSSTEQDIHLSVVDLVMKPPYPAAQARDPLSAIVRNRRSQAINYSAKLPRSSTDTINSSAKQNFLSTTFHSNTDNNELDELIDNDNVSDTISTTINPFDSTLLCVKSIIPSAGPQHTNHHLLQHLIDVYQDWAGSTIILEDIFLKLKRNLIQTEYLTFYSANCENIESLKRYRGYCEPLLLFFGSNILVHIQYHMNAPQIEKSIEEQLNKELQVIKENRKREPIDDLFLTKYSENNGIQQMNGINNKESFSTEPILYKSESLSLRSLLMKTAEKIDQDYWLSQEPYKLDVALFVIKPDLVANGKKDEILDHLRNKGFIIHTHADKLLNDEDMIKIFKPDLNILNEFIRFMYSGPSTYAVVSKGYTGRSTSDDLHYIIGLNDPDLAKENNPESLTAIYGTDIILNGFYSSHTNNEALKEIQIVFPEYHQPLIKGKSVDEYVHKTATLCLLGPAHVRSKKGAIIQAIVQHGFEVRYEKTYAFRPDEVESLYIKHRNDDFFKALVEAYTDGSCLLLYLAKENCVADFCELLGPFSRKEFSKIPGTLRHDFDEITIPVTTIHGSENIIDARKELEQFFPYQQTLTIIKPGLTSNQKNDILKRLNLNGFTIMIKETRHLTKDILTQFYARHQGLPWFNDFIQFMSSDVCEVIILAREDAVQALREIMGPVDPVRAKTDAPESIRAIYGLDIMRNGLHASSNNKHAREEIRLLFPDYEFIKSRPIPFHSNVLSNDSIILNDLLIHNENDLYHLESHEIMYELAVHTRTNDNENEESAVFLTLIGRKNETKKFLLQYADNTIHPLQSNQIDIFHFIDQDIGVPKMVKFSHDGRGFPDNWSLTNIEVTIPYRNKIFKFDINELIDEEKARIGYPVTDIKDIETTTNGNCAIIIQTGSAKYASTSADCSILLSGSQGVYAFQLRKSLTNRIPFQNRYRDIFLVQVDEQLDDIEYIVLEHNNENSAPAWFVDFVIIKLLSNKQEYFFSVHRWLSIDYFDGKTKITLSSDIQKISSNENLLENRSNVIRYEIYIVTGSMYDAATCSPVWITINGTRGSIINKYLEIAENESFPFESDNHDLFILYDIDIGEIDKLILGHENLTAEQGWFVQSISIHIPSKQYQSEIYKINKWLNSKRTDGVPLVEIQIRKPIKLVNRNIKNQHTALPQPISNTIIASTHEYESSYTIYILTEDFQSDMNKPNIFINLINETISTNYMRLNSQLAIRENLEKNVLGKFQALGTRIENINTIRLLIRSPDQITRWLPRFILIIIDDTQQIFQFKNSKWFSCSNRDNIETIIIQLDSIRTKLSNENFKNPLQTSFDDLQNINTKVTNMNIQQIENQLEEIKKFYTNETGKIVIDKRDLEEYNK